MNGLKNLWLKSRYRAFTVILLIAVILYPGNSSASVKCKDNIGYIEVLIAQINPENVITPEDLGDAINAAKELVNYAEYDGVIEALINALDRGSTFNTFTLMTAADTALTDIGEPAVPLLKVALNDPQLKEGAISTFSGMDVHYPDVTDIVIESLGEDNPFLISTSLGYLANWGTNGIDLSREISAFITHDDRFVSSDASEAALALGYRQDYVFEALLNNFMEWEHDEFSSNAIRNMARLAPTPEFIDDQLMDLFPELTDPREIICVASILFINDPDRIHMLNNITKYLHEPEQPGTVIGNALYSLVIIGEIGSAAYDDLIKLREDPSWAYDESLLYLINLYENME